LYLGLTQKPSFYSKIARGSGEQQKLYQFLKVGIKIDIATAKALRKRSARHLLLARTQTIKLKRVFCRFDFLTKTNISQSC